MVQFLLALVFLLVPAHASGFQVIEASESGIGAHWHAPALGLSVDEERSPLDPESLLSLTLEAAQGWTRSPCLAPEIHLQGPPDDFAFLVDGENRLLWLQVGWPGSPAELALTQVTRDKVSGVIVDADILMNSQDFAFSVDGSEGGPWVSTFAVIRHELGHFFGLDHSTSESALMFPSVAEDSAANQELSGDDDDGICFLYARTPSLGGSETGGLALPFPQSQKRVGGGNWALFALFSLFFLVLFHRIRMPLALAFVVAGALSCDPPRNEPPPVSGLDAAVLPEDSDASLGDSSEPEQDVETDTPDPETVENDTSSEMEEYRLRGGDLEEALSGAGFGIRAYAWEESLLEKDLRVETDPTSTGYLFSQEGTFTHRGVASSPLSPCRTTGTWAVINDNLELSYTPLSTGCPASGTPISDLYSVFGNDEGIALHWVASSWTLGPTENAWVPHRMELIPMEPETPFCEVADGFDCSLDCNLPTLVTLTCGTRTWSLPCFLEGETIACENECLAMECTLGEEDECGIVELGLTCAESVESP